MSGGGSSGGGSSGGGSSGGGASGMSTGGQATGGATGGGGMAIGGSTAGTGAGAGAKPAGGTAAKPTGAGGAAGGKSKSGQNTSKASKARISWLVAQQKARLDAALQGIYQSEINVLTDGAMSALRRSYCLAGPGPTTPCVTTPGAPPAPGTPAPVPAPAQGPTPTPGVEPTKAPPLSDGTDIPKGAEQLQALAEKCDKEDRLDDEMTVCEELLKVRGSSNDWNYVGYLKERMGDPDGADEAYGKALAIDPALVGARAGKVFVAVDQGKAAGILESMAKDAQAPKNDFLWLLATSWAAAAAKQAEPARAALEQAVKLAGEDIPKLRAAIDMGIDAEVRAPIIPALDICIRKAPDDARFTGLRLVLIVEEGPPPAATKALEDVEKLAPDDPRPMFFLSILAMRDGKEEKAISLLKKATTIEPKNAIFALAYAHALDRKGSKDALAAYAHAAELDTSVAEPWIASALLVHNKGDFEDAEGKLLAASKAEPRNPEPLYYLAIIEADRLGFLGKALDLLREYARLGGEDETALAWLQSLEDEQEK